jgi:hypothetical protein
VMNRCAYSTGTSLLLTSQMRVCISLM